uniref:SKP1 component POZ domain-containing protein n=1 Tax=Prolemur simus TaxID=1328070 RepID=A0A8C8ZS53_PROSS
MDGEEKTYGGCEGPDTMYVKLISSDGHEFIVKREQALTSGTIKAMLSGPGQCSYCPPSYRGSGCQSHPRWGHGGSPHHCHCSGTLSPS